MIHMRRVNSGLSNDQVWLQRVSCAGVNPVAPFSSTAIFKPHQGCFVNVSLPYLPANGKIAAPFHFSMFDERGFELERPVMICGGHQVPATRRRSWSEIETSVELVEVLTARRASWCFRNKRHGMVDGQETESKYKEGDQDRKGCILVCFSQRLHSPLQLPFQLLP
ncbi:uncharacterized protein BDV17DRAFT_265726 [Aspergillus undulatus]|uniref:uncharacterized protein n=1 Tax=Aspergillus undulatus TaxID=1810928 RepID=UPI003CCD5894